MIWFRVQNIGDISVKALGWLELFCRIVSESVRDISI